MAVPPPRKAAAVLGGCADPRTAPRDRSAAISIHAERWRTAGGPPVGGRKELTRAAGFFFIFIFLVFLINHPPLRDLNMEMASELLAIIHEPAGGSAPLPAPPLPAAHLRRADRPFAELGSTNERPGSRLRLGLARLRGGLPVSAQHGRRGARCRHQVTQGPRRGLPPALSLCLFVC